MFDLQLQAFTRF